MERPKIPKLQNVSKLRSQTRAVLIVSPAFYHWPTSGERSSLCKITFYWVTLQIQASFGHGHWKSIFHLLRPPPPNVTSFYGKLKMYKVAWFAEYTLVSSLNHLSWIISSMSIQFDVVYHLQSKFWETLWRWQTSLWQTDKIYWQLNQLRFLNSIRSNRTTLKKP